MSDGKKSAAASMVRDMLLLPLMSANGMTEFLSFAWPLLLALAAVIVSRAFGIDSAPIAARFVFGASTFVLASACSAENIRRRSAERRLARAIGREDMWKTAAMAAEKVVPEVVGRSLDEWFAAHGIGVDAEKSREAMENLDRFANSMLPKDKR